MHDTIKKHSKLTEASNHGIARERFSRRVFGPSVRCHTTRSQLLQSTHGSRYTKCVPGTWYLVRNRSRLFVLMNSTTIGINFNTYQVPGINIKDWTIYMLFLITTTIMYDDTAAALYALEAWYISVPGRCERSRTKRPTRQIAKTNTHTSRCGWAVRIRSGTGSRSSSVYSSQPHKG